jgi:hypothetical protein
MISIIFSLLCTQQACAYMQHTSTSITTRKPTLLHAKNKKSNKLSNSRGFGKSSKPLDPMEKTYDLAPAEAIDEKVAMEDFFKTYTEWHPLFASIATHDEVPASTHIDLSGYGNGNGIGNGNGEQSILEFDNDTPWVKLPDAPSGPDKESRVASIALVLDSFQKALTDIPVSEKLYTQDAEDNNDLHLLEEGRRLLVLQRFQVIDAVGGADGDNDNHDELFRTCWSEIHHLVSEGGGDTGSLIILEDSDDEMDLANFVDTKIRLPLQFLGLGGLLEVAGFERGKQCVRLIQNLGAMPSLEERDDELDREADGFQ